MGILEMRTARSRLFASLSINDGNVHTLPDKALCFALGSSAKGYRLSRYRVKDWWLKDTRNVAESLRGGNLVERGRSKSKAGFELKCYRCHEPGHFKKNCPQKGKGGNWKKKQGKAGDRKDGPSNSANVVEQDDSEDGDMLSVSTNPDHLADSWILDSSMLLSHVS
ncbi:hypothetical protein Vadar_033033 [Vaccinium darrowii]|uniref:Uncharacterized protein n=1 Tax=Vaccinium darrowii TaxID=229202 RepID=A0ACB7Z864_9ERIC|nr:hypothetical protein Vadar_033033 [Vaccinium darrowii]